MAEANIVGFISRPSWPFPPANTSLLRISWVSSRTRGKLQLNVSQRNALELRLSALLVMNSHMARIMHQHQEAQAAIHLRTTFTGWSHDTAVGPLLRCVDQLDGRLCPAAVDVGDVVHRQSTVQAALADRAAVLLLNPQGVDDGWVALNAAGEITPVLRITQQLAGVFWPHLGE